MAMIALPGLHASLSVKRLDAGSWATLFHGNIAADTAGEGLSVFRRKRDAESFAMFLNERFAGRLDARCNVTAEDREAIRTKLKELHR